MNLKSIAEKWLKDNGYDGLCNPAGECGCYFDDFMPCSEPDMDCQAGHKEKAPAGSGADYFIYPGKANKLKEAPDGD